MADTTVPFAAIPAEQRLSPGPLDPCTLVIMGASGDLTARKLVPALYRLYQNGCLPDPFLVVGCGRTELSDSTFRDKMRAALESSLQPQDSRWQEFAASFHYRSVDYGDLPSFFTLAEFLRDLDSRKGCHGNRLFYLAIPPSQYESVARMPGGAGLAEEKKNDNGWSRIVVEKPFGRDVETAVALNRSLQEHFPEHQIFRIDHYLAKETVQNILMFRFANSIFEPIWNRRHIDHVSIIAAETLGVEPRAGYYEQAGVLRGMFHNHMMQLLSLTAMESPSLFEANRVRDEKTKVFRCLRPFPVEALNDFLVLGQYGPGLVEGGKVAGYRDEPGVKPDSLTPTYATMKVFIDNWRWQSGRFTSLRARGLRKSSPRSSSNSRRFPTPCFDGLWALRSRQTG